MSDRKGYGTIKLIASNCCSPLTNVAPCPFCTPVYPSGNINVAAHFGRVLRHDYRLVMLMRSDSLYLLVAVESCLCLGVKYYFGSSGISLFIILRCIFIISSSK